MLASVTDILIDHVRFTDDTTFSASESSDNVQCYHISKSLTALDWTSTYRKYANTAIILSKFARRNEACMVRHVPIQDRNGILFISEEYSYPRYTQQISLVETNLQANKICWSYYCTYGIEASNIQPFTRRSKQWSYGQVQNSIPYPYTVLLTWYSKGY